MCVVACSCCLCCSCCFLLFISLFAVYFVECLLLLFVPLLAVVVVCHLLTETAQRVNTTVLKSLSLLSEGGGACLPLNRVPQEVNTGTNLLAFSSWKENLLISGGGLWCCLFILNPCRRKGTIGLVHAYLLGYETLYNSDFCELTVLLVGKVACTYTCKG